MPTSTWNLNWLNHNSQRAYPLADDATRENITGDFTLPDDFLLELQLSIGAGQDVQPGKFYVRYVGAYTTGFSVVVGYDSDDGPINVATALVSRNTHVQNDVYALGGVGDFADCFGKVVIGRFENIDQQPVGLFEFDIDGSRLEPDAIRPMIRGVSSIVVVNGSDRSQRLYGQIELIAGTNTRLTTTIGSGDNPQIRIDAIEGEGLTEDCVCDGNTVGDPIRTISSVGPDAAGNLQILGDDCLTLETITNGLRFKDVCSKPCCGCIELERVTSDLTHLMEQQGTMQNFLVRLEASVTQTDLVVLSSRLSDDGCVECV